MWNEPSVGRIHGGCFALFDEMGAGKTKQVIDAAQILFEIGEIDLVIVITPNTVRPVWVDPDFGELEKHSWEDLPVAWTEYRQKTRSWGRGPKADRRLDWIVTNYDFIRKHERLEYLLQFAGPKTMLVLDESTAIKNPTTQQFKACLKLRRLCKRVIILNGTPIANNPGDLFAQMYILDPKIIDQKNWFYFRSRYGILGGFKAKQIVGWRDVEDLQRRIAPYCLRRLKMDCLDLPPKLDPVIVQTTLTPPTWKIYKDMRDDMLAWLDTQTVAISSQAAVKAMRLAQITSGFLGGIEDVDLPEPTPTGPTETDASRPPWVPVLASVNGPGRPNGNPADPSPLPAGLDGPTREIGSEKLETLLDWIGERLENEPNFKLMVWCRFRVELQRSVRAIEARFPHVQVGSIIGGQKADDRQRSLSLLHPNTAPEGPVVVLGITQTGATGINLTAAHDVFYLSFNYSLFLWLQSIDRVHRPGQTYPVSQWDCMAIGPDGQKTIDHVVLKAVKNKDDIAKWTTSAWVSALREE
jgi:hypothetical protein